MADAVPRGRVALVLAVVAALVWFGNLDYRRLIRTDEGRYAEIAREMVVTGDWLTPRSNGYKYFEKPPLQYWATAAAFEVFGPDEWTARLWTALTGALGIVLTGLTAARVWGARIGWASAAILGGSVMWIAMGHFAALDMGLAFFLGFAVSAFVVAQAGTSDPAARRRWMLAGWAAAALAVLSKGLVGIVLPGAAIVLYMLWTRDWALWRRLEWLRGGLLFLAIAAPWFVAVSLANPEFFTFFFIHEHFERFLTRVHGRYEPPWYFLPVLALGLVPWTLFIGHAMRAGLARSNVAFQPERFLLAWIAAVMLFFSASSSKLPSYIVPLFPALAVLAAIGMERAGSRFRSIAWALVAAGGIALTIAAPIVLARPRGADAAVPSALLAQYGEWIAGAGVIFAVGGVAAWWLERGGRRLGATLVTGLASLYATQAIVTGHECLSPVYSAYHVAREVLPEIRPATRLFAVDTYDHTLPFYLGRTLTMVAYRDELAQPIAWEPADFIPDDDAFRATWLATPDGVALMNPRGYARFAAQGLPMRVLARDTRRVIVATLPRPGAAP